MKIFFGVILLILMPRVVWASTSWPKLNEFSVAVGVDWHAERIDIDVPFIDDHDTIQYRLICRGGGDKYLDSISDGSKGVNYVGPLMCILNIGNTETETSLLAEDDSPPWLTRGQFHTDELMGACASYPEYGRVRHFKLRGFELSMEVFGPIISDGKLEYSMLRISVHSDANITSKYTDQPGYKSPYVKGRTCNKVLKGNDPRVCRDLKTFRLGSCAINGVGSMVINSQSMGSE
jgi:hypothetical protein